MMREMFGIKEFGMKKDKVKVAAQTQLTGIMMETSGVGTNKEEQEDEDPALTKKQMWDVRRWFMAVKSRTMEERRKEREERGSASFWKYSKERDWKKLLEDSAKDLHIDLVEGNPIPFRLRNKLAAELRDIGFRFGFDI